MKKDYDLWRAEQGRPEPFIIGGEEFTPRIKLPWEKFGKLILSMDTENDPDPDASNNKMKEFFQFVLVRKDRQRFADLIASDGEDDEEAVIDMVQLQELTKDLMELFTGKVLESAEESSPGPSNTGLPSNAGLSNVVSLTPREEAS